MIGVPGGGYQRPDTGMIGVPGGGYQRPDTGMIGVGPSYQRPDTGMIGVPGYGYQRPDTGMITVPGGYQRPDTGMITVPGIPGVTDPGDPGDLGVFGPVGNMLAGRGNATGSGSCFYPDLMQLHRLMNRHAYARYVKLAISSHGPATPLHVVIVDFCRDAIAQIVGNANIVTLQKTVTGDGAVSRALKRLGRQPSAVIGLDKVGTKVTLYIL
jgi:hypothetical protein